MVFGSRRFPCCPSFCYTVPSHIMYFTGTDLYEYSRPQSFENQSIIHTWLFLLQQPYLTLRSVKLADIPLEKRTIHNCLAFPPAFSPGRIFDASTLQRTGRLNGGTCRSFFLGIDHDCFVYFGETSNLSASRRRHLPRRPAFAASRSFAPRVASHGLGAARSC